MCMISPINSNYSYGRLVSFKNVSNNVQNKRNVLLPEERNESKDDTKALLACIAALLLTVLTIGVTISAAVKTHKENIAKDKVENLIKKNSMNDVVKDSLNIVK